MIKSITVTNYLGETIKMILREPEKSGFLISSITGLGPAKANINTKTYSTSDGSMFNSSRLEQRNIVIEMLFVETTKKESIEDIRQKSYKYFPIKKEVELVIETDRKKVKTVGYIESNEPNIFSKTEGTQISIICPDPYFYLDGSDNVTVFSGIEPTFEFPFENESSEAQIMFGAIQIKTENVITYHGDAETGVTIRIHAIGPVSMISLYNVTARQKMVIDTDKITNMTGEGLKSGDDIVIITTKGRKSITLVREGNMTNIMNCLEKNVDWFTITKGDNIFAFSAESGITNLQLSISNRIVYEGV